MRNIEHADFVISYEESKELLESSYIPTLNLPDDITLDDVVDYYVRYLIVNASGWMDDCAAQCFDGESNDIIDAIRASKAT